MWGASCALWSAGAPLTPQVRHRSPPGVFRDWRGTPYRSMKNFRHMPETRRSSPAGQPAGRPLCAVGPPPSQQPLQPCPLPPDFKQRLTSQFDARAERYDVNNTYHPPLAERLVRMAALQPGQRVLDIGCGTGFVALLAAAAVGPGGQVTGVDLSEPMIRQAEEKAQASSLASFTSFLAADADACDFPPASFDAVLCSSALPFLPDIPAALARWRRWLRPGGRVGFNVPKGVGSRAFTVYQRLAATEGLALKDPCAAFADEAAVRRLLAAAGFSSAQLAVSTEVNMRMGQTPEEWAAAGWAMCAGMPFADLPALLGEGRMERMRRAYLVEAAEVATRFAGPEGVAEPYEMLWVLAAA